MIQWSQDEVYLTIAGTALTETKLKVVGSGIQGYDDYPNRSVDPITSSAEAPT